jgi:hypothetical protein
MRRGVGASYSPPRRRTAARSALHAAIPFLRGPRSDGEHFHGRVSLSKPNRHPVNHGDEHARASWGSTRTPMRPQAPILDVARHRLNGRCWSSGSGRRRRPSRPTPTSPGARRSRSRRACAWRGKPSRLGSQCSGRPARLGRASCRHLAPTIHRRAARGSPRRLYTRVRLPRLRRPLQGHARPRRRQHRLGGARTLIAKDRSQRDRRKAGPESRLWRGCRS